MIVNNCKIPLMGHWLLTHDARVLAVGRGNLGDLFASELFPKVLKEGGRTARGRDTSVLPTAALQQFTDLAVVALALRD